MTERLDRIEVNLQRIEAIASQNVVSWEETKEIANSNARAVEAMLQQMAMDREERNAVLEMISKQQRQLDRHQRILKGLQTENRRILDLLINNPPDLVDDE
jgi:N-acyl-D-aspartate/D-glutamate deacylase